MFGPLIDLLVLFSFATLLMVAWKFLQQRADEKLRDNPPQKRIIEVSLPVGVGDSASNMTRFYRKAAAAALGDKSARKQGLRQIDFVYLVDVPAEGALPRMRCRIYADPDKMDAVKKALKSSFQEAIDLVEIAEDELLPIARVLRPPDEDNNAAAPPPEDYVDDRKQIAAPKEEVVETPSVSVEEPPPVEAVESEGGALADVLDNLVGEDETVDSEVITLNEDITAAEPEEDTISGGAEPEEALLSGAEEPKEDTIISGAEPEEALVDSDVEIIPPSKESSLPDSIPLPRRPSPRPIETIDFVLDEEENP